MQRRRTKMVKLNDVVSLEKLLQETYTDSCALISETAVIISDLTVNGEITDADDLAKITKEKINALKVRDSAIKLKLDIAKIMNDVTKNNGNEAKVVSEIVEGNNKTSEVSDDMFEKLRNLAKEK